MGPASVCLFQATVHGNVLSGLSNFRPYLHLPGSLTFAPPPHVVKFPDVGSTKLTLFLMSVICVALILVHNISFELRRAVSKMEEQVVF